MRKESIIIQENAILNKYFLTLFVLLIIPLNFLSQVQDSSFYKSGRKHKTSPLLYLENRTDSEGKIRVLINNSFEFKKWLVESQPGLIIMPTDNKNIFEISVPGTDKINSLLDCQWIDFVDLSNRKAHEERTIDNSDLTLNKITPVHALYPFNTGEGLVASIKERPFDTTDIDLLGRIVRSDPSLEAATLHATFMATFIAGAGNSAPKGKGAAWKAQVTSSSFSNLLPDDGQKLTDLNVSVQNHSYGVNQIENYYGIETMEYDRHCQNYPEILHVFSSGNIGLDTSKMGLYAGIPKFANLSGQFKMSKNTISIGATDLYGNIAELSSRGPAYDGRVKPELVAYGDGGTSDAAALTSGICLLVQDAYKANTNGSLPSSSLVKSVIINSADDVGRPGIDFESGYGSIDAYGAVKTIIENRFYNSSITQGEEKVFNISVPADKQQLKVTLVWNDPEATINSSTALVNDLNLELHQTSTGLSWKPWVLSHYPDADSLILPAQRMVDHLNNIEQVTLAIPESGSYEIHIFGEKIEDGQQNFSLSYEFEAGFEWIYPLKNAQLEPDKAIQIRWQFAGVDDTGILEYQIAGSNVWNLIGNEIKLSQFYFDWIPPDISALAVIRFRSSSLEFITDTVILSKAILLKVGYNCDDEVLFSWEPLSTIDEYMVYTVGENYLEKFKTTTDTFIILDEIEKQNYFYAVSPIIEGIEGIRGNTINYAQSGVDCYIISFFATTYVTDSVLLELKLASNYRLISANLERLSKNEFIPISSIEPLPGLLMTFEDLKPYPNRNVYRICLRRDDQKLIYSDEVELFYNPVNNLFVYPNPVLTNQELNVINGDDLPVTMKMYDNSGKLMNSFDSESASIKVFPVKDFKTGLYILEVISGDGQKMSKQIMVLNPK